MATSSIRVDVTTRRRSAMSRREAMWGVIFAAPAVVFFGIFWVYPLLNAVLISLSNWDLLTPAKFVGFKNYVDLLNDANFKQAVNATLYYAIGSGIPTALIAFGLALLVNRKLAGKSFFQTAIFVPAITSWIVAAIVWRLIYLPDQGLYLLLTEPFGISGVRWLTNRDLAMPAIIIMSVWKQVGPNMIIFLAGLQNMPEEIYDAAAIDGANSWQALTYVTLPLLKPTILFVMIMLVIGAFQTFTPVYVLTGGGPANVTRVVPLLVYQEAFQFYRMGKAAAESLVMFIAVMVFTIINMRIFKSDAA